MESRNLGRTAFQSDAELIAACSVNDQRAHSYVDALLRRAVQKAGFTGDIADETHQDLLRHCLAPRGLLQTFQCRGKRCSLETWLAGVARKRGHQLVHRKRSKERRMIPLYCESFGAGENAESLALDKELRQHFRESVQDWFLSLCNEDRLILNLWLGGKCNHEISGRLGISLRTLERRLYRLRQKSGPALLVRMKRKGHGAHTTRLLARSHWRTRPLLGVDCA